MYIVVVVVVNIHSMSLVWLCGFDWVFNVSKSNSCRFIALLVFIFMCVLLSLSLSPSIPKHWWWFNTKSSHLVWSICRWCSVLSFDCHYSLDKPAHKISVRLSRFSVIVSFFLMNKKRTERKNTTLNINGLVFWRCTWHQRTSTTQKWNNV